MRYSILFALLLSYTSFGQKNVFVHIDPVVSGVDLQLNTVYNALDGKTFKLDYFDYYLSDVLITHDGGQTLNLYDTIFLVKHDDHMMYLGNLDVTNIEQIDFSIGVPKSRNTQSGILAQDISTYPENHPLSFQDPSMYWGWQGGYMHMIIGGYSDGNDDQIPDVYFEVHNLGDHNQQPVSLTVNQTNTTLDQIDIYLNCNFEQWIKNIPLSTVGIMHDEIGVNKTIMDNVQLFPVFTLAANAGTKELDESIIHCSASQNQIFVDWSKLTNLKSCSLIEQNGRVIKEMTLTENEGKLNWNAINAGFYLVQFTNTQGQIIASKKVIMP